jgi:hypothetical protein
LSDLAIVAALCLLNLEDEPPTRADQLPDLGNLAVMFGELGADFGWLHAL